MEITCTWVKSLCISVGHLQWNGILWYNDKCSCFTWTTLFHYFFPPLWSFHDLPFVLQSRSISHTAHTDKVPAHTVNFSCSVFTTGSCWQSMSSLIRVVYHRHLDVKQRSPQTLYYSRYILLLLAPNNREENYLSHLIFYDLASTYSITKQDLNGRGSCDGNKCTWHIFALLHHRKWKKINLIWV